MHRFARIAASSIRSFDKSQHRPRLVPVFSTVTAAGAAAILLATPTLLACESSLPSPSLVTGLPPSINLRKCQVTLYQFESCPFCRKARAVLDLCGIPYDVVEVNPLTKSETKGFASDYKKVPIVVVDDPSTGQSYQIRDSKVIIAAVLASTPDVTVGGNNPSTPLPKPVSLNDSTTVDASTYAGASIDEAWIKWTEAYLLQLVVVNIYGTFAESRETFDYLLTHKDFGWVAREASYWAGSIVMNQVARSRLKKFNHIQGRHREAFFEACADLGSAAKAGGAFLGGKRPSAADVNAYGVIRSLEGTKSLREAIAGAAGEEFAQWYANMNSAVGESKLRSKVNATPRGGKV